MKNLQKEYKMFNYAYMHFFITEMYTKSHCRVDVRPMNSVPIHTT